ncbi:Tn3 family transposase [Nocardia sp. CY41]|uniref:Tn3 family transposase n=1 Tax=Nocardia sp. CY41 TaxID=2608686 RepID=UPI003FA592AD
MSALGLVVNCVVLGNTVYMDRVLAELRAQQYLVLDADVTRLSPFIRAHIGIDGYYSFIFPISAAHRPLRDPDIGDDENL